MPLSDRVVPKQAALAYDLAALKFRGPDAATNYDTANYVQELLQFNDVRAGPHACHYGLGFGSHEMSAMRVTGDRGLPECCGSTPEALVHQAPWISPLY